MTIDDDDTPVDVSPLRALRHHMSAISERRWAAGWYHGLEYMLWAALTQDTVRGREYDDLTTRADERELRRLSDLVGGWIWWPRDASGSMEGNDTCFIPLAEWEWEYARWRDASEEPPVSGLIDMRTGKWL